MKYFIVILLGALLMNISCGKAPYITDEGLHNSSSPFNTYDYLKQHPAGLFDTLILVIDHFGLKEQVNSAKTFFAPTNYSIRQFYNLKWNRLKMIDENATYSLGQMMNDINLDSLKSYVYDEQFTLDDAQLRYRNITNLGNIQGFAYHKQRSSNAGTSWSSYPVYHLYLVKIRGEADVISEDGAPFPSTGDLADIRVRCQTTGIKTASGTTLHVLANTHTFITGFYYNQNQ